MIRWSLSSRTPKRPSGRISSISPSMVRTSSFAKRSGRLQIDGRRLAVRAGLEVVADPLVLVQPGKAGGLDRGDVDESVVAAGFVGDEAVAAIVIEELDGADSHDRFLSLHWDVRESEVRPREPGSVKGRIRRARQAENSVAGDDSSYDMGAVGQLCKCG